ncbi:uncharacterized protein si:ch211-135n15.2 isoform X2 [Pseudorasbora parva]|uniref:uncharacterized protein si:ch211-135n15.2 isoform X2 n=1 Tax=Pseudorasbora parva TaxID=51549 RepID=UPI00351DB262
MCLKMPRRGDVSFLQQPASPFDQCVVSKFMMIRPKVLGVLEISLGMGMIALTIWTGFLFLLWSCLISVSTGSVTLSAACKLNTCQGVTLILLVGCDVLVFVISVIVTSSSCVCMTKSRHVAVSYINRDVPYMTDNNIVLQGHFAPPPNYDPSPLAPPAYYNTSPSAPPAYYNTSPSAPPPTYNPVLSAPPLNYVPGLSEPPPSYNQVLLHLQ